MTEGLALPIEPERAGNSGIRGIFLNQVQDFENPALTFNARCHRQKYAMT